jgi:hypothetical protein
LTSLVRHLGIQLEVLVTQASRPKKKGEEVARNSAQARHDEQEGSSGFEHESGNDEGGTTEGEHKELDTEDFVSHAFYRQHIEEGFERRALPKLALSTPFNYPIDDAN